MQSRPGAYSVLTEGVDALGRQVLDAAVVTEELARQPGRLPARTAGAGSAGLAQAVEDFAQAWTRECGALAHDTRLLGDALTRTAASYREVEWFARSLLSPALGGLGAAVAQDPTGPAAPTGERSAGTAQ